MEEVAISETFASQSTAVILAGVAGRQIGIRGMQLTIDAGPGAGSVCISDGVTARKLIDFGNPSDPSVITMPITPKDTFWAKATTALDLVLVWSYAGSGSVKGTLQYDWLVDPTGYIGNA